MTRTIAATVIVLSLPLAAAAQSGGAATQASQGPMVVERVESGFLVAPDVKVTRVDGMTSELAGAYAGWLTDGTIFVGGGGYWMANNSSDRQIAYGGLIVQWLAPANDRVGFSVKGLIGGGQATLASDIQILPLPVEPLRSIGGIYPNRPGAITNARIRFREGFFVAEPEVGVYLRLARHVRLTGGASYRLIGAGDGDGTRLRGAAGSVGIQIGGGS